MNRFLPIVLLCTLGVLSGCASTPDRRIQSQKSEFDGYSPAVQAKIRAGEIDVGYTPQMVRMALGEPSTVFVRDTAAGKSEVWAYLDGGPSFSLGLGLGSFGSHVGGGLGVSVPVAGGSEEKLRVIFKDQKVEAIERTSAP